ncbi:MAG: Asp23/Gls24 family envelope stress response protein [Christensenellales bacterium]|jgi:uncharacterized alkaline shock family protein YloU
MADHNTPEVRINDNPEGTVSFATEVVATIAGLAANEVEGVASMTSSNSALADILSRKSSRNYTKGVKVDIDDNMVAVDVTIVVEYGSPVPDVARSIQENIKKAIETMSGLDVRNVDVHVQGVSFERENRAVAELDEKQKMLLRQSAEEETALAEPAAAEQVQEEEEAPLDPELEIPEDDDLEFEDDLPEVDEEFEEDSET